MVIPIVGFRASKTETTFNPNQQLSGYEDDGQFFNQPSYMVAADTHNLANDNQSFLESLGETVSNIPKFVAASLVSGVNQFYNILPSLGNALGGEFEKSDTHELMQSIDDDLAKYYTEHESSTDALGFMLSSIVPGVGGIKVLSAGQKALETAAHAGKLGNGLGKSMALLSSAREANTARAIKSITSTDNPFRLMDQNVLKAMGAGFGQSILEATAFETAVAATMFDSPVLEDMDVGDIVYNIALGGVVFGSIGGVIDATRTAFSIKKAVKAADQEAAPWQTITPPAEGLDASDRILVWHDQIRTTPEVPKVFEAERMTYLEKARENKVARLNQHIRSEFAELANGDQTVAALLAEQTKILAPDKVISNFLGNKSVTRFADTSDAEAAYHRFIRDSKSGRVEKYSEADIDKFAYTSVSYEKVWGDRMGNVVDERPVITQLADTITKRDGKIEVTTGKKIGFVKAGKAVYKFNTPSTKKMDAFDVTKKSVLENNARQIWASKLTKLPKNIVIYEKDLPLLEKAYKEFTPDFKVMTAEGERTFLNKAELRDFIADTKEKLAYDIAEASAINKVKFSDRAGVITQEEISSMLNVRNSYLSGEVRAANVEDDLFALDSYAADFKKAYPDAKIEDIWNVPQHTKTVIDSSPVKDLDGNVLEGMAIIKQREREYIQNVDRIFVNILGEEDASKFINFADGEVLNTDRTGAGAGWAAAASANYGTVASKMEYLGRVTNGLKLKAKEKVRETLDAPLHKVVNSESASIEFATLNARLRGYEENFALNEAGDALVPVKIKRYEELVAAGKKPKAPELAPETPIEIRIENPETLELIKHHIEVNGVRRRKQVKLRAAQGLEHHVDDTIFYPIPVNQKDFPFFATVTDESITGGGHTRAIYANTEKQLDEMISKLHGEPGLVIRTKKDAENYWKSVGQFDYDKTLHDNFLDSTMKRKGVSMPYYVPTDPQKIAEEFLAWHTQRESSLIMELVSAKYEKVFGELRSRGEVYTNLATSKVGSLSTLRHADEVVENPYMDYVKTALDIRSYSDYPFWTNANRLLDSKISQMYSRITDTVTNAKSAEDLTRVNELLKHYGYKGAAYDERMELLANHTAPKGVLSNFIQKTNALLATTTLRLDHLNAVNNAVGANVLLGAETKAIIRAIERGDSAAVGELAALAKIKVPGTDKLMLSPKKMIANAIQKFGRDTPEMKFYKDNGFVTTITDQYKWTLDQLTLGGKESVKDLTTKPAQVLEALRKAADKGEQWTGNRLAEEFNRFVAADVMKQMTDVAVKHGLMDDRTALSYINTFVNRTQGNYLASQRPMLFQGPIGQAIGLFQTYQFNLMQQLLRHVGEGKSKDYMTLLGLQGTIYGMNGMPAFNAINTHIIGSASGNTEHKDAYDLIYGAAGKEAGDWLTYGLASNLLLHPDAKINLYTRGDINPRHVTIVPTNPADVPIYGAATKFFGNLFNTAEQLVKGGDVSTVLLQGLEHNGISRPLAGLAQTLQGLNNPYMASYSTTRQGNVIASNDILSIANMGRMVGGKPMSEAVAVDAAFRLKAYAALDSKRRSNLGNAIKSTMIAGQMPTQEQIDEFAYEYAKLGGKQTEFNKWMMQLYKKANQSQVNQLRNNLEKPYAQTMQKIMGGYELRDFWQEK